MAYLIAFGICILFTMVLELLFKPSPILFFRRNRRSLVVSTLLVLSLFLFVLLITQRPYFSSSLSILGIVVILIVNNTKYKTLREPLVFSDFFLYLQAIKHPRLYLPFLGVIPLVGFVILVPSIAFIGFYFESAKYPVISLETFGVSLLLITCIVALQFFSRRVVISGAINEDCRSFGVLAILCCYGSQAAGQRKSLLGKIYKKSPFSTDDESPTLVSPVGLADVVIVQSESFFDARLMTDNIKIEVLAEYDKCLLESRYHGQLQVPAWGANTMRTEFAFLTGLESRILGLAQFYPYQQLINMQVPSIVSELKSQGYWCVCIHPNASSFFMRDTFFQQLGFDEFIDADEFENARREGPYVADVEVSNKIEVVLSQTEQPCFVFAITMENHGPLHLESVSPQEWRAYYDLEPVAKLTDLTVYLRHLKNADTMIKQQLAFYRKRSRDTVFTFYGDHVPAISGVFDTLEYEDSRSNYFIWSSAQSTTQKASTMMVESLARTVLNTAKGFI